MDVNLNTGNHIVDEVGKLHFTGNIIPETWYQTIVNEKGKLNTIAVLILSDIVYWYRPTEIRDEHTLSVSYQKKFSADLLQRSYEQLCNKFNISKKQARDALIILENLNVIKRHLRTVNTPNGALGNVMFIELLIDGLIKVTYPEEGAIYKNVNRYSPNSEELITKCDSPVCEKVKTNTKNTTQITTEISTTTSKDQKAYSTDVVANAKEILSGLSITEKDALTLLRTCDGDLNKLRIAKEVLDNYKEPVANAVGFLIKAIQNNYHLLNKKPEKLKNSFHNFEQRDYNKDYYAELEKRLLFN